MQVVDNLVVHRAPELRVRMQDDRNRCVAFFLRMIAAFEAAFGSWKNDLGHRGDGSLKGAVQFLTNSLKHLRTIPNPAGIGSGLFGR